MMRKLLYISIIALFMTLISLSMFTPAFDLSFYTSIIYISNNIINIQLVSVKNITLIKIYIQHNYYNSYIQYVYVIVSGNNNYYNLTGNYVTTPNELIESGQQSFFQFGVQSLNNLRLFIVIIYKGGGEGILSYYI